MYSPTFYETGIVESYTETIFSYYTGTLTSIYLTAEKFIFEATETGSGAQTGSNIKSSSSSLKSGSSASTSSTTKRSGEIQTVKYTLISIASAFGLILVAF